MATQGPKPSNSGSLARSLGQFFGHVWHAVGGKTPANKREVRREVDERRVDTPDGPVTLRRTTIEEIEISPPRPESRSGVDSH